MDHNIAAIMPGWEIVRRIGSGSCGAVYEVRRNMIGQEEKAALKVFSVEQDPEKLNEVYRAYRQMESMKGYFGFVNCDDIKYTSREDGTGWDVCIRMELLTPLLQTLSEITEDEAVIRLGIHLCNTLAECSKRDLTHGDIKPQNILVSRVGYYKLGDFGIAKALGIANTGTTGGNLNYMAPEVYRGEPYGAAADIYSLGLVMYWMLNKRRAPFLPTDTGHTMAEEEEARRRRLMGEPLPRPAEGSERLQDIVLKACAFHPEDRYLSAADMLRDLQNLNHDIVSDGIIDSVVASVFGKEPVKPPAAEPGVRVESGSERTPAVDAPRAERREEVSLRKEAIPAVKRKKKSGILILLVIISVVAIIGGVVGMLSSFDFFDTIGSLSDSGDKEENDGAHNGNENGGNGGDVENGDAVQELEWSEWVAELPDNVFDGAYVVETRLQYRSAPLYYYIGGETLTDEFTVCYTGYGDWSKEWSRWQTTPITASADREVETGTRYWYRDGYWQKYDDVRRDTPDNPYTWVWYEPQYTDNVLPEAKSGRERLYSKDQTIYRYRTRPTTYYCVKDSEWSEYGDEVLNPSHDTMVSTRIVYRYAKVQDGGTTVSMQNFPREVPAYTSRFADVPNSKWYGAEQGNWIGIAVEIGAMSANEYLCFRPEENITVGELIKAAVTLRRVYNGEPPVLQRTTPWYGAYVDYAIETGIIEAGAFSDYGKTATRAEAAYILGNALPETEYGKCNTVRAISDMDLSSMFFKSVWRLAESGVIAWENPEGSFDPDRNISRAEVAAMIGRIAYPDKRVTASNG